MVPSGPTPGLYRPLYQKPLPRGRAIGVSQMHNVSVLHSEAADLCVKQLLYLVSIVEVTTRAVLFYKGSRPLWQVAARQPNLRWVIYR